MIQACIFDLDGVIVDTAKYHYLAWKRLAGELGFDLTEKDNEQLKGVSRMGSLQHILNWAGLEKSEEEKIALATRKNEWYKEYIAEMTSDEILDGVMDFLADLRKHNIKMALGSASKNAVAVIQNIGLMDTFEVIIDGTKTTRSKPDPQVFQLAAEQIGCEPAGCIVFEDAVSGVEAALAGGFYAVGIGSPANLSAAHLVIPDFKNHNFEKIVQILDPNKITDHEEIS